MPVKYREDKATQAAARLLELHGGRMNYMKLIKLLYLAERAALVRWGRPITFDQYYSLPHGPVLSLTYNRIVDEPDPEQRSYWHQYISAPQNYVVELERHAPNDQLSQAEEELLDSIYGEFGQLDQWQLRDATHELPEWVDPDGSSVPITARDILLAEGYSEQDVREIESALEAEAKADELLGGQ